ncbi:MAG: hypothetical protein WAO35_06135 [Terriglobia bacterium]
MTTIASLQRMRPNWGKLIAVTLGSVVIAGLIGIVGLRIFRILKCEDIDAPSVRSPNGKWVVQATTEACPAGPLSVTNYRVIVTLAATPVAASAKAGPVQIFESDDSAEPPTITWGSANVLLVKVADAGAVRVSKHELTDVKINYVVPKWLWDRFGEIESIYLQQDREAEELHKAGKMSSDDLRLSLQSTRAVVEEWTHFRQWALENASLERDPANDTPGPK